MLKIIMIAAVAVAGLATPTTSRPADPFDGIQGLRIDKAQICKEGVCVLPEEILDAIAQANILLAQRLKEEVTSKAKKCAVVTPERRT